eukprot:GEMP01018609.1.p1 GENE.GEMP01018609.1~~GEMP01018609.1.p1  ORF type:complete len:638 (+),score=87.97 GEMP01018609.1:61-1974(+)
MSLWPLCGGSSCLLALSYIVCIHEECYQLCTSDSAPHTEKAQMNAVIPRCYAGNTGNYVRSAIKEFSGTTYCTATTVWRACVRHSISHIQPSFSGGKTSRIWRTRKVDTYLSPISRRTRGIIFIPPHMIQDISSHSLHFIHEEQNGAIAYVLTRFDKDEVASLPSMAFDYAVHVTDSERRYKSHFPRIVAVFSPSVSDSRWYAVAESVLPLEPRLPGSDHVSIGLPTFSLAGMSANFMELLDYKDGYDSDFDKELLNFNSELRWLQKEQWVSLAQSQINGVREGLLDDSKWLLNHKIFGYNMLITSLYFDDVPLCHLRTDKGLPKCSKGLKFKAGDLWPKELRDLAEDGNLYLEGNTDRIPRKDKVLWRDFASALCAWTKVPFKQDPGQRSPCLASVEPYGKSVRVTYHSAEDFHRDIWNITAGDTQLDMSRIWNLFHMPWPSISEKDLNDLFGLPSVGVLRVFDLDSSPNGHAYRRGVRKHWKIVRINGKLFRNRKYTGLNSWLPTHEMDLIKINAKYPPTDRIGPPFKVEFESNADVTSSRHVRVNYHCMGLNRIFRVKEKSGFLAQLIEHFVTWCKKNIRIVESEELLNRLMDVDSYMGRFLRVIAEAMPSRHDDNLWPSVLDPDLTECTKWIS